MHLASRLAGTAVLFGAFFVAYLDRTVFPSLLVILKNELHLSNAQVAFLSGSAFAVMFGLASVPFAFFFGSYGLGWGRSVLALSVFCWSVMTAGCSLKVLVLLFICRIGVGLGEACLHPVAYPLIASYFRNAPGLALGVYYAAPNLGVGMSFLLASFSYSSYSEGGELWRYVFIGLGMLGMLWTILILVFLRVPPELLERGDGVGVAFVRRNMLLLLWNFSAIGCFAICDASWAVWNIPFFSQAVAVAPADASFTLSWSKVVSGVSGSLVGGFACDKVRRGAFPGFPVVITFNLGLYFISVLLRLVFRNVFLAFMLEATQNFLQSVVITLIISNLLSQFPSTLQSLVGAMFAVAYNFVGFAIGPPVVGVMLDLGSSLQIALLCVSMTVAAAAVLSLTLSGRGLHVSEHDIASEGALDET